jgi:hypothetical protein
MLLKDGNLVYQGRAEYAPKYFNEINIPMPAFCNPFDFFLETLSDCKYSSKELNGRYNKLCEQVVREEKTTNHEKFKSKSIPSLEENLRQVSWCLEFWLLLKRTYLNYVRNKSLFLARILNCLFNSLIIMGFYWKIGDENKKAQLFQNFVGFFFNNCNQFFINGLYSAVFMIPSIKVVLKREVSAKLYRVSTFYFSIAITLLVNSLIFATIYTPIIYLAIKFYFETFKLNLEHFLIFYCLNFFNFTLGQYTGLFIGSTFSEELTYIISPLMFIVFMLGSGFYRGNNSIPSYISWLLYVSPYKYVMELLMRNFNEFSIDTKSIPDLMNYNYGAEICLPVLFGMMILFLMSGWAGLKLYSSKF